MTKATRTSEGGLGHWGGNYQFWVDTLYMVCPLFSHLTRADLRSGVPRTKPSASSTSTPPGLRTNGPASSGTCMTTPRKKRVGVLWGRGNGWVVMSYVEVLRNLRPAFARIRELLGPFQRQMDGLLAMRDPQGPIYGTRSSIGRKPTWKRPPAR